MRTITKYVEVEVEIEENDILELMPPDDSSDPSAEDICELVKNYKWFSNDWAMLEDALAAAKRY